MQHHILTHVRLFGALALISALLTTATPAAISYADATTPVDTEVQAISDAGPITPTLTLENTEVQAETFTTYLPIVLTSPPVPSCISENRAYELQVMALINAERQKNGLPALVEHAPLTLAACRHSRDMADNHFLSHTGSDGSLAGERVSAAGYPNSYAGEIIGQGFGTPQEMVNWWINSPNHHAIMLSATATEFGVGYALVPTGVQSTWPWRWTIDFGSH